MALKLKPSPIKPAKSKDVMTMALSPSRMCRYQAGPATERQGLSKAKCPKNKQPSHKHAHAVGIATAGQALKTNALVATNSKVGRLDER